MVDRKEKYKFDLGVKWLKQWITGTMYIHCMWLYKCESYWHFWLCAYGVKSSGAKSFLLIITIPYYNVHVQFISNLLLILFSFQM